MDEANDGTHNATECEDVSHVRFTPSEELSMEFETFVSKIKNMSINQKIIDVDSNYHLPGIVLREIHNFIILELYSSVTKPEFSEVIENNNCVFLEPLFSKSQKKENFINNCDHHGSYYAKVLHLIIRDYPLMEPTQKSLTKIKNILDLMKIRSTKGKIKDDINFMKVYFKSIRSFFYSKKPSTMPFPKSDSIFVDILIERSTSSKYMVVPYTDHAWGRHAKSNVVFVIIYDGNIFQFEVGQITSGKTMGVTTNQIMAYWGKFLRVHLERLEKGRCLFYSGYYQKQECFETHLLANYKNQFECITFDYFGYGLSPIHHIKEIKGVEEYKIHDLYDKCSQCWRGKTLTIAGLLETNILDLN